jgi:hypothetical protein
MSEHQNSSPATRAVRGIVGVGGRAAAITLRPLSGLAGAAVDAGIGLERRAVDRVLDSPELERLIDAAVNSPRLQAAMNSPRLQAAIRNALASDGVNQLIDSIFEAGVFDRLVDRLLASDALWRLIDEVAASPAVTAAVAQQSLGFADQVGDEVRARSRRTDDLLERAAHRLLPRRQRNGPPIGEPPQPDLP